MDAYTLLTNADGVGALDGPDLELRATAAYMTGLEQEYLELLSRAYRAHLNGKEPIAALRCAFWVALDLARRGESGEAGGWLERAERLLEQQGRDRVERGHLLLPRAFELEQRGEWERAAAVAGEAVVVGRGFGDVELQALAGHEQGRALIRAGRVGDGLARLDEAMRPAAAGELSPIVTGLVYCGSILACHEAVDLQRARAWTSILSRWCREQPMMIAFTSRCLVHRAEVLQLQGAWRDALREAGRAFDRCEIAENRWATAAAAYRRGELYRLSGELGPAEEAYREAGRHGRDPQPGMALLRLAEGDAGAAAASIRRALEEADGPTERIPLLPAYVEIMLVEEDVEAARRASGELHRLSRAFGSEALAAHAAHAAGAVELFAGEPGRGLAALHDAARRWRELDAPYETARARELIGRACKAAGNEDTAMLELEAASAFYAMLDAVRDQDRVDERLRRRPRDSHGLTERELEVLRLVAPGMTDREIAGTLTISARNVARHLQSIFDKLGVDSRAAAGAYAYEHRLI